MTWQRIEPMHGTINSAKARRHRDFPSNIPPRRGRDHGLALARVASRSGARESGVAGRSPYPKRFAALFMGNGINANHWWAKGAGAEMELGKSLEPLAPFRRKMNVITGLFNKTGSGRGHSSGADRQHPFRHAPA